MDEVEALVRFEGGDDATAREAFECLAERARPFLRAYLTRRMVDPQDQPDLIQDTCVRLWRFRSRFRNRGVPAWYGLLKRTADRCRVDLLRTRGTEASAPDTGPEEPATDEPDLQLLVELRAAAAFLRARANVLWLGLDPALPAETHDRQLLAAQLYYVDGLSWPAVLRLLGPGSPGEPPLTRERLDSWLADPGVLRYLAYSQLYLTNDQLAAVLLGLPADSPAETLDALERGGPAAGGWTAAETACLLWRYRHALLLEQIAARRDCALSREELGALFDRSRACQPFSKQMLTLLDCLDQHLPVRGRGALRAVGLWQRLAFQYHYQEALPHRDILERLEPAAREVDYSLTAGMLNVWLSNGRLLQRLARHCAAGAEGGGPP